jgi:hypothetical protein
LWELISPLLPTLTRRFRYPGRKRLGERETLQGILFVLYTGIAWRHLPLELGSAPVRPAGVAWTSGKRGRPERPRPGLEPDLENLQRLAEHEGRAEDRVPGKRELRPRREDPDPRMPVALRPVAEHHLRERHLTGEQLSSSWDRRRVSERLRAGCPRRAPK